MFESKPVLPPAIIERLRSLILRGGGVLLHELARIRARDRSLRRKAAAVPEKKVWNSLEIAKLLVATLTPLTIGLSAAYLSRETARQQLMIAQVNREQDKLQEFWKDEARSVAELAHFGLAGDEIKASEKDRMEQLEEELNRARVTYGPFLTDNIDAAITQLTSDAADFEDHPDDTTGWKLFADGGATARQVRSTLRASTVGITRVVKSN